MFPHTATGHKHMNLTTGFYCSIKDEVASVHLCVCLCVYVMSV